MIRLLHFSDIHFGQENDGHWEPHDDVRNEVLHDLRKMLADSTMAGPADVILVSGDPHRERSMLSCGIGLSLSLQVYRPPGSDRTLPLTFGQSF